MTTDSASSIQSWFLNATQIEVVSKMEFAVAASACWLLGSMNEWMSASWRSWLDYVLVYGNPDQLRAQASQQPTKEPTQRQNGREALIHEHSHHVIDRPGQRYARSSHFPYVSGLASRSSSRRVVVLREKLNVD